MPKNIPNSSALESASAPSVSSRSRGLNSGRKPIALAIALAIAPGFKKPGSEDPALAKRGDVGAGYDASGGLAEVLAPTCCRPGGDRSPRSVRTSAQCGPSAPPPIRRCCGSFHEATQIAV